MDQNQIDSIVRSVIQQIEGNKPTPSLSANKVAVDQEEALDDLGGDAFQRNYIGVQHPKNGEALKELRKNTAARVASGRTGPRPRTTSLLRFLADHSRSKDTVLKEIPSEWVAKANLLEVQSEITTKDLYLTRPDLGRRLSKEAIEVIKSQCKPSPQVQIVVSDGLSTDAITANLDEILPPLIKGLENAGLKLGTPFFVRYGRVKIEDHIGELLGAEVVILLVGERPGLGQSESLSCYMIYQPTVNTVEADRTCISNIHQGGTPPVEAAAVIVDLAKLMLEKKASGIALNR
ncbi:MAG: ethanolamine ammonia-lyase subunit EutC [Neisseriales bacterium]|nr:MAG: ethanolamine ammonia-lyase subunit EutC [Neisseriales bacterium]